MVDIYWSVLLSFSGFMDDSYLKLGTCFTNQIVALLFNSTSACWGRPDTVGGIEGYYWNLQVLLRHEDDAGQVLLQL